MSQAAQIPITPDEYLTLERAAETKSGIWRFDVLSGREARVRFESIECEIALADFFDGVELSPLPPARERS